MDVCMVHEDQSKECVDGTGSHRIRRKVPIVGSKLRKPIFHFIQWNSLNVML